MISVFGSNPCTAAPDDHPRVGSASSPCPGRGSFPGERSVEGLAKMPSGPFLYVIDRDHNVHLRFLLAEDE
jgi:hypothetical protein